MNPYTIWMGYDPREDLAYRVARHSILSRTDPFDVYVQPIDLADSRINAIFKRPIEYKDGRLWCPISQAPMATEFAISRFCAFFLPGSDWSLFVDSDIVCTTDIRELWKELDDKYAVMCVKHKQKFVETVRGHEHGVGLDGFLIHSECDDCRAVGMKLGAYAGKYDSKSHAGLKMDGQIQTFYARKNWSSVMAINTNHPANKRFTLEDLNNRPGRDLHAFFWLKDDEIGAIDSKWNYLVGVDNVHFGLEAVVHGGICHYTLGGKWFPGWDSDKQIILDKLWDEERKLMESACKSCEAVNAV